MTAVCKYTARISDHLCSDTADLHCDDAGASEEEDVVKS